MPRSDLGFAPPGLRRIPVHRDNMLVEQPHSELGRKAGMESNDRVWRELGLKSAVLAGDERAWQTWYEESFDSLYAFVHGRYRGRHETVADVVQETWLTAVRRIRTFDPQRASFANWLRGIAANILRNTQRRELVRRPNTVPLGHDAESNGESRHELDARDQTEQVMRVLATLTERYEAVLRMKYLEQLSVAEIARICDETPKAVESLLTRARQTFREAYEKAEANDGLVE